MSNRTHLITKQEMAESSYAHRGFQALTVMVLSVTSGQNRVSSDGADRALHPVNSGPNAFPYAVLILSGHLAILSTLH